MTAHELARLLLAGPDLPVAVEDWDDGLPRPAKGPIRAAVYVNADGWTDSPADRGPRDPDPLPTAEVVLIR